MNKVLWVVQILLAVMFLFAGGTKITTPMSDLAAQMPWVEDFSDGTVRGIGGLEVAGAVGLVVPAVTGIVPVLTPAAAGGLALTMVGAAITQHRSRRIRECHSATYLAGAVPIRRLRASETGPD